MAEDKIIRQARGTASTQSTDTFNTEYQSAVQSVDFPLGVFIIFIFIDLVDIIMAIFGVTSAIWSAFLLVIALPFQIWYLNHREKKYSEPGSPNIQFGAKQTQEFKSKISQIQKLNREAAELMKAGDTAGAAAKLGNAKKVLPRGLRWVGIILEKIPFLNFIPLNSILILLSYYDNKESVRAIQEGYKTMASGFDFKLDRKITRPAGSNSPQQRSNREAA